MIKKGLPLLIAIVLVILGLALANISNARLSDENPIVATPTPLRRPSPTATPSPTPTPAPTAEPDEPPNPTPMPSPTPTIRPS